MRHKIRTFRDCLDELIKLIQSGLMTPNEARAIANLPPINPTNRDDEDAA